MVLPRDPVAPEFVHAFETLERAVVDHEDDLARRIAAGIRARRPGAVELELLDSFERILRGRELLAGTSLSLVAHPVDDPALAGLGLEPERVPELVGATHVLTLRAEHAHAAPLVLRLPPATLRRVRTACALQLAAPEADEPEATPRPTATDSKFLESHVFEGLEGLDVPVGAPVEIPLLGFACEPGRALAVREHWTLEARSGEVVYGGEPYPAQRPRVADVEVVARAPYLPTGPVPPEELLSYARRETISAPALMERAVRIPNDRRVEAALLLATAVDEFSEERLEELAPALRWLTGSGQDGGDPRSWRTRLQAAAARGSVEPPERGGLDLPGVR